MERASLNPTQYSAGWHRGVSIPGSVHGAATVHCPLPPLERLKGMPRAHQCVLRVQRSAGHGCPSAPPRQGKALPSFHSGLQGSSGLALMEDNQMRRDSATPASQCRHSVTLSPGVPNTFLAASGEASLVESKAYFPSSSSISAWRNCLQKAYC